MNQALNVLSKFKKNWVGSVWVGEGIIHEIKNSIGRDWGRVGRGSGPQGGGWGRMCTKHSMYGKMRKKWVEGVGRGVSRPKTLSG